MDVICEPLKIVMNLGGKQKWQSELDVACGRYAHRDLMLEPAARILLGECNKRFMGMAHTEMFKHTVSEFFTAFNNHIVASGLVEGWKKDELKFMMNNKQSLTIIHHSYTYKYNIHKGEVDFFDNGRKIHTYRSDWVKRNVGDEHSFCVYALRWMAKNGVNFGIIDAGHPFKGIHGIVKLEDFLPND
ncbi:hypothetical protein MYOV003v1_p0070 [Vibrio phage 207E48.1]|nr:hypothetical protein MYOV003v1_p0070 [Vibrio phage 207E48.1]